MAARPETVSNGDPLESPETHAQRGDSGGMFGKYMSTLAIDAQRDAERRRADAFRELMARPDAEPEPVRIVPARPSVIARLRRSMAGLALFRRRPSRTAPNR